MPFQSITFIPTDSKRSNAISRIATISLMRASMRPRQLTSRAVSSCGAAWRSVSSITSSSPTRASGTSTGSA